MTYAQFSQLFYKVLPMRCLLRWFIKPALSPPPFAQHCVCGIEPEQLASSLILITVYSQLALFVTMLVVGGYVQVLTWRNNLAPMSIRSYNSQPF